MLITPSAQPRHPGDLTGVWVCSRLVWTQNMVALSSAWNLEFFPRGITVFPGLGECLKHPSLVFAYAFVSGLEDFVLR